MINAKFKDRETSPHLGSKQLKVYKKKTQVIKGYRLVYTYIAKLYPLYINVKVKILLILLRK